MFSTRGTFARGSSELPLVDPEAILGVNRTFDDPEDELGITILFVEPEEIPVVSSSQKQMTRHVP